jgi:hypothetical protein
MTVPETLNDTELPIKSGRYIGSGVSGEAIPGITPKLVNNKTTTKIILEYRFIFILLTQLTAAGGAIQPELEP